jgi:hypothetical protein
MYQERGQQGVSQDRRCKPYDGLGIFQANGSSRVGDDEVGMCPRWFREPLMTGSDSRQILRHD